MAVMAPAPTMPMGRPLTLEDFEAIRDAADDGHRYELVDGCLIVTPSPTWKHQRVSTRLVTLLVATNPDVTEFEVLHGPFDVRPGGPTNLQPDVMVFTDASAPAPMPLLVVEILSPSTRHIDLGLKWSRFAAAGIAHYWVVDPEVPSVTAWSLERDRYVVAARAEGEQEVELPGPWTVLVTPARLVIRG